MKHIKSIIRFAALLLVMVCAQSVKAQQIYIMVHKNDGNVLKIAVSEVDSVTFREWTGPIFSYEYVDLGLSVKWATCNVGAQSPEQTGGYFAWGETEEKDEYYSDNNKFIDSDGKLTKYNLWQSLGKVDMKYRLDPEDDAAAVLLGDGWRTPTREEFQELRDFCDWAPAVLNGVQGYRVTSRRNDNSIFLPLTGERWENDTIGYNRYAYYYSNTMAIDYANSSYDVYSAYMYYVDEDYYGWYENTYYRTGGLAIRPVYSSSWESGIAESAEVSIEESEVNIEVGQSVTLNGSFVLADGSEIRPEWKSSNAMIARVDYSGRLYGVSEGQCMIYASYGNNSDSCLVTVTGFEQEMEYVDLGLSVNWATCNIGASRPEYVGLYFAWGETEAKAEYDNWSTYKYSNSEGYLTKYNQYPSLGVNGFVDNLTVLEPDDDAAHVIWGDEWRMPTYEEITELVENCDFHEIKDEDGILGYYVTSRVEGHEKSSIFIPYTNELGAACFWTSSIAGRRSDYAALLVNGINTYIIARCAGMPIRPVCPNYNYVPPTLELSSNELAVVVGKTSEISAFMNDSWIDPTNVTWISSDTTVATIDIYGIITAKAEGTTTITATYKDQSVDCVVTVIEAGKPQYVDLGLSVEWATFNIGATSPEELGNYYAWGETEVKDYYDENNYKWFDAENNAFLKYNLDSRYGDIDLKYRLDPDDDVAHVTWGDGWRMPTNEEFQELIDNCYWSWVNEDGFYGYVVQSSVNGNSIFLPAAGYKDGEDAYNPYDVIYMSSSLVIGKVGYYTVYCLEGRNLRSYYRFDGYPVRAVHSSDFAENTISVSGLTLDEQNVSVEVGQQRKLNYSVDADTLVPLSWVSDNPSVARVSSNGTVLGMGPGECTITASLAGFTQRCTVTVTESETVQEWVDLGLSVKWATTNIGASRPEYTGGLYAWGETAQKDTYDWKHHSMATYEGDSLIITKYNEVDGLTSLEPDDDVAHILWGDNWRIPTTKEFNELVNACEWTRTQVDGTTGYEVTGPNGNSIFLPVSGYMYNSDFYTGGPYYYTSSAHGQYYADYLYPIGVDYLTRIYGFPVRAVTPYSIDDLDGINLNHKSLRLMEGNTCKLEIKEKISDAVDAEWISTDETVVMVQDGLVTALGLGTANVIVILDEFSDTCEVTVADPEYVNLGLSVNWATINIGAYSPEESGDYYAWGETETKSDYSWSTYKFGDEESQTKYSEDVDGKTVLDPEDDVAHVLWGGDWRMPNVEEFNELIEMCSWEMTTINGINGYVITSKVKGYEDNWIFLPLAGYIYDKSGVINSGLYGDYWSSSKTGYDNSPYELYMGKGFFQTGEWEKKVGLTIRPVCKNNEYVDKVVLTDDATVLVNETVDGEPVYKVAPRIVADPADSTNNCIIVTAPSYPENYYDAQLYITVSDSVELTAGAILELSFRYKADNSVDCATEIHSVPGEWAGEGPGYIYFSPRWQNYSISTSVMDPDQRVFVINLAYLEEGNNFYFDDIAVTIVDNMADGFILNTNTLIRTVGEYGYLYAHDNAGNELNQFTQWVSTNDSVAVVNSFGEVRAIGEGTCYILASYRDYKDSCEIIVNGSNEDPYLELKYHKLPLKVGESFYISYNTNVNDDIYWESSNRNIVSVDKEGVITAESTGSCIIIATVGNLSDSCLVIVRNEEQEYVDTLVSHDFVVKDDSVFFYCYNSNVGYEMLATFAETDSTDYMVCTGLYASVACKTAEEAQQAYADMTSGMSEEQIQSYNFRLIDDEGIYGITYNYPTVIGMAKENVITMMRQWYEDMIDDTPDQSEYQESGYIGKVQAFLPAEYADSNAVAAWYQWVDEQENRVKYEAVFLFEDGSLVVTKSKFYTKADGRNPELEILAIGQYELTDGDFDNGIASVILSDGSVMDVEIDGGVLYAMNEAYVKQKNNMLPEPTVTH